VGDALPRGQRGRDGGAPDLGHVIGNSMPIDATILREGDARATAESVARRSYGKLVAFLAGRTGDVAAAEDALSEAFAAALTGGHRGETRASPGAGLMPVARRRMIDAGGGRQTSETAVTDLRLMSEEIEAAADSRSDIPDDRLALMFACAHPSIDQGIRAPLILQCILGFDAATIASAFLVSPAT